MSSQQSMATVIRGHRISPTIYEYFPCRTSGSVGTAQIVCGVAILILGIMPLVIGGTSELLGICINLSILAVIAGSFGIAAGRGKTACKIVTDLVMSTLSAISACGVFIMSVWLLMVLTKMQSTNYYVYGRYNYAVDSGVNGCLIALMVFSLIEAVAALWSSIVACQFVCFCCRNCCCQYDDTTTDQILMSTSEDHQPLQQVVTYPNDKARDAMQSPPRYEE